MKKSFIAILILVIVALGLFIFYREGSLPVNKNSCQSVIFTINQGEGLNSIVRRLSTEELIRSRIVFYLTVKELGIEKKIQAGDFRLSQNMDAKKLAEELTHGTLDQWVQVKEGLRKEEIAEIFSKDFSFTENEFNSLAPEGYLFPDTYLIPKNATAQTVINIMTNEFDKKYLPEYKTKAAKLGLTQKQVVILASIVEREARTVESKRQVADILLKRLDADMPLQLDSTVQYLLGYDSKTKTWWRADVSGYTTIDSAYNTYTNQGLPPGPISNPGTDSIEAVVNADPNATKYYFFLVGNDNKMHYAVTNSEHEKNIQKYLDR
jgi:UPF0755 protein